VVDQKQQQHKYQNRDAHCREELLVVPFINRYRTLFLLG
jgi:hypothetical protein